ncbi:GNAT family N-acetyltransferase [Burkholderia singularis]|uniref:GNAT family N-acetyltransferase n=1 Tax=Burkholderia singularis TaxID=1503053 RepID=UPI000AAFBA3F|nr:GNAT family N-acetyltransferase [Burkholderia singularis]
MSDLDALSQIQLDIGHPHDFPALRRLRKEVFVDELGIQDITYRDVFNDWYSKNILLRRDRKIVGAVRVAFSRDQQEFYISYLVISKSHRKLSYLRLLFGAAIHVLQVNGIRSVRADSADLNLSMYLSAGCEVLGPKFKKYGFNCDWTPLRYVVGTNGDRERKIVEHAALLLGGDERLRWRFAPILRCCEDQPSYDEALVRFIESNGSAEIIPHVGSSSLTIRSNAVVTHETLFDPVADASTGTHKADLPALFDRLNETLSRDHVVVVNRCSAALNVARTYSTCTGKYLVCIDHPFDVVSIDRDQVKSVLWLADSPADIPEIVRRLDSINGFPVGFVLATSTASASVALLSTFLDFLHPADALPVQWIDSVRASSYSTYNAALGGNLLTFADAAVTVEATVIGIIGRTHCIVSFGAPKARIEMFINTLLSLGFSVGTTVRFANLAYGDELAAPLILIGDPSVRLAPERPSDTRTSGDPESQMTVRRHDGVAPDSPSLLHVTWRRNEQFEPPAALANVIGGFGAPLHTTSCADRDLQHLFLLGASRRMVTEAPCTLPEMENWPST